MRGSERMPGVRSRLAVASAAVAVLALVVTGCTEQPTPTTTSTPEPTPTVADPITAAFADAVEGAGYPGGALAIRQGGSTTIRLVGDADLANGRLIEDDARFGYRQVTASFTATVVLQLAAEGLLDLDDPVSDYATLVPGGDRISIRDLLAERSGLADYLSADAVVAALEDRPTQDWNDAQLLSYVRSAEPVASPGTVFDDTGSNALLLGEVIERVTGRPWADEVALRVLEPLGLASVGYPDADPMPAPRTKPYRLDDGDPVALPSVSASLYSAAGGLTGTIGDLARWAQALGTGELLDEGTRAGQLADLDEVPEDAASQYDAYGLGIGEIDGWLGHVGDAGGFSAVALYDPTTDTSVAILLNATGGAPDAVGVFDRIAPLLPTAAGDESTDTDG